MVAGVAIIAAPIVVIVTVRAERIIGKLKVLKCP